MNNQTSPDLRDRVATAIAAALEARNRLDALIVAAQAAVDSVPAGAMPSGGKQIELLGLKQRLDGIVVV